MSKLKFVLNKNGKEYSISGKNGTYIGDIAEGEIFPNRIVLYPLSMTEWTSECLRAIADKIDEMEKGSQR
jgi:hypothetical protein